LTRQQTYNEEIVDILYKHAGEMILTPYEQTILQKWLALSSYNRSVFIDVKDEKKLRMDLCEAYVTDKSQLWNKIICYRIAMHSDINKKKGYLRRLFSLLGRHS
jgi:hypothetical protein